MNNISFKQWKWRNIILLSQRYLSLDIKKLNLNEIHYFSEEKFSLFLLQQPKGKEKEYEKHIEER